MKEYEKYQIFAKEIAGEEEQFFTDQLQDGLRRGFFQSQNPESNE